VRLSALAPSFISLAFLFRFLRLCLMRGGGGGAGWERRWMQRDKARSNEC